MNINTELYGKFQFAYIPNNRGGEVVLIEKIDKYTDIRESSERRFGIKFEIYDNINDIIDRVYRLKGTISKQDATELVHDFLT